MSHAFDRLVEIMATLRGEGGCPWDREQDHHTLKRYLIEEAYEVLDAIDDGDDDALAEELGDLLLQVVFHSQIAAESGRFTIRDVIHKISEKMIRRHPHVFGDEEAADAAAVLANWEQIKRAEKGESGTVPASILDGVPKHLPPLAYAFEVQRRAAKVGFDWPDAHAPLEKVAEEAAEVLEATRSGDRKRAEEEWGDLFFALVNAARHAGVRPDEVTRQAARKFESRFRAVERKAHAKGLRLEAMQLSEMDALWDEAKREGV